MEMGGRRIRRATAVALAVLLVPVAVAVAAAHLKPGALYTGKTGDCGSSVHGTTCVVKFRASASGLSMKFVGKTVIDTWGCNNGGGEALLGGHVSGFTPTPIPRVKVHSNGTLSGSVNYAVRAGSGTVYHYTSKVTGHLVNGGKKAVITFRYIWHSSQGNQPCKTQPVTLVGH